MKHVIKLFVKRKERNKGRKTIRKMITSINIGELTDLKIRSSESSPDILIIQHLDLKCEIFLQVFHYHDQEWEFYAKCSSWICWASNVCGLKI